MLGRRHQLHMGEAHLHAVGGELFAELAVTEDAAALFRHAAPGGQVDLVDRHRTGAQVATAARFHPGCVVPDELRKVADDGGVIRGRLEMQAVRIRLQERRGVMRSNDLVLIAGAGMHPGDEDLPDTGGAEVAHRVGMAVPKVMVADDRDAPGGGRPDREGDARHPVERADMGTELIVGAMVVALAEQEEIVLRDRRQEAVRVVDHPTDSVGIRHPETVAKKGGARKLDLEDATRVQ